MKIIFVSINSLNSTCYVDNEHFWQGPIDNLPEEIIKEYKGKKIEEPFIYSNSSDEIKILCKALLITSDFKRKVEILIDVYSKSNRQNLFVGCEGIVFKATPESPDEYYIYNSLFIQYYIKEDLNCNLKRLKEDFDKRQDNTPTQAKLFDSELLRIKKTIEDDIPKGVSFWYNATNSGSIPRDEAEYQLFLSKEIDLGIKIFLQGKALAEYEIYLEKEKKKMLEDEGQPKNLITTLSQLFKSDSDYHNIMSLLVEKKFCDAETFFWIYKEKGRKSALASLIKLLHSKGYYSNEPTNLEVQMIAKNTFGLDIGIDAVKHTKNISVYFKFIPVAKS